ncbi:MAG: response regulator transcription factor [Wolinella sp.]
MYHRIKDILQNVHLLIVEDDVLLQEALRHSIEQYVQELFICSNAREALACFEKESINLIISDIHMPLMNGIQMASIIRKRDSNVPIIFLTAYDNDENLLGALEVQSVGILKKPLQKRELIMMMSFAVNKFQSDFACIDLDQGFCFNAMTHELTHNGNPINLTKKEQLLLHLFLKNQGRVVSFLMIEQCLWYGESCSAEMIRSFVYKLRKKIYPELIENSQGNGYRLNLTHREGERTTPSFKYI